MTDQTDQPLPPTEVGVALTPVPNVEAVTITRVPTPVIVYNNQTGDVIRTLTCTPEEANAQLQIGEAWITGEIDPATHKVHPGFQSLVPLVTAPPSTPT